MVLKKKENLLLIVVFVAVHHANVTYRHQKNVKALNCVFSYYGGFSSAFHTQFKNI